jgi:rRNA maturation endonuclease Nob1
MKTKLTIDSPLYAYPDELIQKHISNITGGDTTIDNVVMISNIMLEYIVNNEEISEEIKEQYYCIYGYLKFNLNLMKEIIKNDEL